MPELPEVETVRRGLADLLPGQAVVRATVFDSPKSFPNSPTDVQQFLSGAHVTAVRRRAKVLMIDLDTRYSLVIHLKMTGQLIFRGANSFAGGHPNDSLIGELPDRSTRVQIDFTDGSRLFFNDQRKFGWMKLMPTDEIGNLPFMQKVGPEPLDKKTEAGDFIKRIRRRQNSMIKPAFLDQLRLSSFLDQLALAEKVTDDLIDNFIPLARTENVFDLFVSALAGDYDKVHDIISYLESESGVDGAYQFYLPPK
jgi:formamidopyrimidine-DNA glycosylase